MSLVDEINIPTPAKVKAILFDIGGVMVDINRDWADAVRQAGLWSATRGYLYDFWAFGDFQLGKMDQNQYLEHLRDYLKLSTTEEALSAHNAILKGPYEGSQELVEELNSLGFYTGCLSNTNEPHWVEMQSGRFPNLDILQGKFVSHELALEKPNPAIYQLVEDKISLLPAEIFFFDDTEENIEAALEKGWRAHWIDHTQDPVQQMELLLIAEGVIPAP